MNFELSHEHQMLKELVGKFVRDQLMPYEQAVIARENVGQGTYLTAEETAKVDAVSRELGLNPAKVNAIARDLGLEVGRHAAVEQTVERIRACLLR